MVEGQGDGTAAAACRPRSPGVVARAV